MNSTIQRRTDIFNHLLVGMLLLGITTSIQAADAWPQQPVKLVVPFPAGGNVDTYARVFAPALASQLKTTVIIENKPGATGAIGVDQVARSEPNGYTILLGNITSVVGTSVLSPGPVPDPLVRLEPICTTIDSEVVVLANVKSGIGSVEALQAAGKNNEHLMFGSSGAGSISHLAMVQFLDKLNVPATHVPYKGNGQFLVDLLAGHIQLGMVDLTNSRQYINEGRLTPLAVTGRTRFPELPEVPATAELGATKPNFSAWIGLLVPKGTPDSVIKKLSKASRVAMLDPSVHSFSSQNGNKPVFRDASETRALIAEGMRDWGEFVKSDLIAGSLTR